MRLGLGVSGGMIRFVPTDTSQATITEAVTVNGKCGAATTGSLLTITAAGGSQGLGLVTRGLGVRQKNTCSAAEGRLGGSERLAVALGTAFGPDVFVVDAELDMEGKFNAGLNLSLDGAAPIGRPLASSSDNGPDSGIGDNDRVLLSTSQSDVSAFRSVTLAASGGELALEGGGDATYGQYAAAGKVGPLGTAAGTADTILRLVRVKEFADDLSCDETRAATVVGGSASGATVTRLENVGGGACEDVGVTFEVLDEGVLLDKGTRGLATGTVQSVQANVEIVWAAQPAQVPLPAREINFDPTDPAGWETVAWCTAWDPMTQTAVHPADARFPGGVLPWCLVEEHVELQSDGTVVQIQLYDGAGDPMWR